MVAMSFKSPPVNDNAKLVLRFENWVGDRKLSLDTSTYVNSLGQSFCITNFKYYVSDIELTGTSTYGTKYKLHYGDNKSFLIRQDDEISWEVSLDDLTEGSFDSISFLIGVDSLHNCSGAQSGALDPLNGMFWTWNSGYIFMKLEGKSPASKSPGHIFEYHIGGYKEPTNFIRKVTLAFKNEPLKPIYNKTTTIYIKTDAAKVLNGGNKIDFSKLSSVTDFHNADMIADNYVNMFSIIRISNEW